MITSFFRKKSMMRKFTSFFTIVALVGQLLAPIPAAKAIAVPDMTGEYGIEFTCVSGYEGCAGTVITHAMTILTEDSTTGDFSGTGASTSGTTATWTMTGIVADPSVTIDIVYNGLDYTMHLTGTRDADGNMTGDATDNVGDILTWRTTSIPSPKTITITATKIICDSETDLPNWGVGENGAPSEITATTAADFIAAHPNCHLASGWDFQYGDGNSGYPDDGDVHLGMMPDYQSFGTPTGEDGTTTITVPVTGSGKVYVAEVQQEGYIPFTAQASHNEDTVTAEFYCGDDIYNYDNFEGIGNEPYMAPIVPGKHYYCVAWNVPQKQVEQSKQCDVISDESSLVEETSTPAVATFVHSNWAHPSWMTSAPFAKWIWSSAKVAAPTTTETKTFIKQFTLTSVPATATIDIAADNGYTLYVNGQLIVDKSAEEHNYEATTAYDVASKLVAGSNTIKVVVTNFAGSSDPEANPAGTIYRLHIEGSACTNSEDTATGKIHVIKFVDGARATKASVNNVMFPMLINHPDGDFMLKSTGWVAGDGEYEATTFAHKNGSKFTITENLATPLVGASCTGEKPYAISGYSTGATYDEAVAAPKTETAPEITINGDRYLIVHNTTCAVEQNPSTVQVHVYKYLQTPNGTAQIPNDATITPFPMHSVWTEPGQSQKEGYYTLGIYNGGAPLKYASITAKMKPHAQYAAEETTTTGYVLPPRAQCSAHQYRLVGYKKGIGSLAAAEAAPITADGSVTDITQDAYIIVVNENCDDLPPVQLDMCTNIEGVQAEVPAGYRADGTVCTKTTTSGGGGTSGSRVGGGSSGTGGSNGSVLGASATAADNEGQVLGESMCSEYIHSYIRLGKKNDIGDVIRLQVFLNQYMGSRLLPTGVYTKETFDVLKAFQVKEMGQVLTPWKTTPGGIDDSGTGYVYKTTKRWINMIKCPQLNLAIPSLTH